MTYRRADRADYRGRSTANHSVLYPFRSIDWDAHPWCAWFSQGKQEVEMRNHILVAVGILLVPIGAFAQPQPQ
jgi:hypothetical protein